LFEIFLCGLPLSVLDRQLSPSWECHPDDYYYFLTIVWLTGQQSEAEQEEERITNALLKRIDELRAEKVKFSKD
jgi:hypothetical protein